MKSNSVSHSPLFEGVAINLSRNPFRNRRLFWLGWLVGVALLLVIAAQEWRSYRQTQAVLTERHTQSLTKTQEFENLKKVNAQTLGVTLTPQQQQTMRSVLFLTKQRGFSWSRLFTQLERETPPEVRIIEVKFDRKGDSAKSKTHPVTVPVGLTVRSRKPEDLTKYLYDINQRGVFFFEPQSQGPAEKNDRGGTLNETELILAGTYNPNAEHLSAPAHKPQTPANATLTTRPATNSRTNPRTRGKGL
ncbi:MAG: hypothetical protein HY774_10460 [Acidobacteria bacterium]|nr:hypothetical protein [Acidobacteriota bacterium]